ncbi:MAG TPA: MG2 domain-containing protein [Clostridiales bacterium]|nr:MG2 domain-containing protein [Clostridiales bacterium]HQP70624.1 MG2 domain-containing protein [Clostridiales bacterium]
MKYFISALFLAASVFLFYGCFEKQSSGRADSEQIARYLSYTPSGVFPGQTIDVIFIAPVPGYTSPGSEISGKVLRFDPDIDGKTFWKDERTISFIPDKDLKQGDIYKAVLSLKSFSETFNEVPEYGFEFTILKRDVRSFSGDVIETSNNKALYEAAIAFNYKTRLEELKEAVEFTMNGNDVPFEIFSGADSSSFVFRSSEFQQSDEKKLFVLKIDKNRIEIASDYVHEFSFTKKEEMEIIQISRRTEDENPSIEIKFASELSPDQEINGLVSVSPETDFELKKTGKSIIISGNFEYGKDYKITVSGSLMNKYGYRLKKDHVSNIGFMDKAPFLDFIDKGCFLSSGNNKKIRFYSQNIKSVYLTVKKVYESNLGQFLQRSGLRGTQSVNRYGYYDYYYGYGEFERVGIEVLKDTLFIKSKLNETSVSELDLSKLIPKKDKGLYVLELTYREENTMFRKGPDYSQWDERYPALSGKAEKNIILSDLGMSMINSENGVYVHVFDIESASPVSGAVVKLLDFQNQVLAEASTDYRGKAEFGKQKREVFCTTAEKDNARSVIKANEMQTAFSAFDIGGADFNSDQTRGYIYTDRGIYRPGDDINVSMIFRNKDNTFPKDHPVKIRISDPTGKIRTEDVLKKGEDGFYSYKMKIMPEDMTGQWIFTSEAGGKTFTQGISVETIVPEMLDVKLTADKDSLGPNDSSLKVKLSSNYLFGSPASGLRANVNYSIYPRDKFFPRYRNYTFRSESEGFSSYDGSLFSGTLDAEGVKTADFTVPKITKASSAAVIRFNAEVLEEGGRPNRSAKTVNIDPYDSYVGIEKMKSGFIKAGTKQDFKTVLLASDGYILQGRDMKIRIYLNESYWWWDYSGTNSRMNYRSDFETRLVYEQDFVSGSAPYKFSYNFGGDGLYLIEVSQKVKGTHSAAFFVSASYWGGETADINSADFQALRSDKEIYKHGETAVIKFPAQEKSRVLVSVDKGSVNIDNYSFAVKDKEAVVEIPVKSSMAPNVYCTVSVIQPNSETGNDRPVRIIGTIPVKVEDPGSKQSITVTMPEVLRPNEKFKCRIKADKESQFTISVVDEGLLSITDFISPDAWKHFFGKLRLGTTFYDLYGLVIGANKGPVSNTFSIGGSMALAERAKMLSQTKADRFKPVALFKGPVKTDGNGNAEVEFTMPEYVGAVRVMAVCADEGRYGGFEKRVQVKTEIIAVPSIPRVLASGDEAEIPVTVFCMDERIKDAEITLELKGPLTTEVKKQSVSFNGIENKTVYFRIKAKDEIGTGNIKVTALSGKFSSVSNTEIAVNPVSPREFKSVTVICEKGSSVELNIPDYMAGTVNATVTVSKIKMPDLSKRMHYLIEYPYGCLEQTVSASFSQLSVKPLLKQHSSIYEKLDENINSGISKLRKFQNANGSFNYWPQYGNNYSGWSDIYAGHFMTEAKKKGYFVPTDMYDNWKRSAHSMAVKYRTESLKGVFRNRNDYKNYEIYYRVREQIYRLYVLALAGEPETGAMNIMKETNLAYLDDTEKWILSTAYKYAGINETARSIADQAGVLIQDYKEMRYSFGTLERDKAFILSALCDNGRETKAVELYNHLIDEIASEEWYSTQTLGFMMLSVGKFMEKYPAYFRSDSKLSGVIRADKGKEVKFSVKEASYTTEIASMPNQKITVISDKASQIEKCFVTLNYDGIPLRPSEKREAKGLTLQRSFTSKAGITDAKVMKQGDNFTLKIRITKTTPNELRNMALVQIIPSGWEIDNKRIGDPDAYNSADETRSYYYGDDTYKSSMRIRYTDIRDDRVMWFFDMDKDSKTADFEIGLKAVTTGKFYLPATMVESMYSREYYALEPGMKAEVKK